MSHVGLSRPCPAMNTANLIEHVNSRKLDISRVSNLVTTSFPIKSNKQEEISFLNLANSTLSSTAIYFAIAI